MRWKKQKLMTIIIGVRKCKIRKGTSIWILRNYKHFIKMSHFFFLFIHQTSHNQL